MRLVVAVLPAQVPGQGAADGWVVVDRDNDGTGRGLRNDSHPEAVVTTVRHGRQATVGSPNRCSLIDQRHRALACPYGGGQRADVVGHRSARWPLMKKVGVPATTAHRCRVEILLDVPLAEALLRSLRRNSSPSMTDGLGVPDDVVGLELVPGGRAASRASPRTCRSGAATLGASAASSARGWTSFQRQVPQT